MEQQLQVQKYVMIEQVIEPQMNTVRNNVEM